MPILSEVPWKRLSLAQQYMLASLAVLLFTMTVIGWWVDQQIEAGVAHRTAATTALFVESFISPELQELAEWELISEAHVATLTGLLEDTTLGQQIVAFKVWDPNGRVLFSTGPTRVGLTFEVKPELARALKGEVVSGVTDLEDEENVLDRREHSRLLEFYIPIRREGTGRIIAVAEFYQKLDALARDTAAAQLNSWLVVGLATLVTYLLLAGIVRRASDTIARQQAELSGKVVMLTDLLAQNQELHERVRRAATRAAELNERFLRRISAELHDGPAQDLSLALLRLDNTRAHLSERPNRGLVSGEAECAEDLEVVQISLSNALQDVRAISTGLRLPELDNLTLAETIGRVVRTHERRTSTTVALSLEQLPEQAALPIKITLYRLIQEALSNAYRHGGGVGQQVRAWRNGDKLHLEISDQGPGFDRSLVPGGGRHLGLISMRERVESLGGVFRLETGPGQGTRIVVSLPLDPAEDELLASVVGGGT